MDNIHKIKHHRQAVTVSPPPPRPVPIHLEEEWRTQRNGAYHLELIHFFGTHLERKKITSFYRHRHHLFYPERISKCFIKTTPRPDTVTHMPFASALWLQSKLQDCTETLPTRKGALCLFTHENPTKPIHLKNPSGKPTLVIPVPAIVMQRWQDSL